MASQHTTPAPAEQRDWKEAEDHELVTDSKDDEADTVTHQMCLVLWTWRKLADETNAKNAPKIC